MTVPVPDLGTCPQVKAFFHERTNTVGYVVRDPASNACALIDSALDFDYPSGRTSHEHADTMIGYIREHGLELVWQIETHVHADHLTAAPYIKQQLGGRIGIGSAITTVQETFGKLFEEGTEFRRDGSQFDHLFRENEPYRIGGMTGVAFATPGHTPACMTHMIGDALFVGDTLFMPDGGTARADFPGGDAGQLYDSIQRILSLPEQMRIFLCHDYAPDGREIRWETSVGEEKADNIHVGGGRSREAYIALREKRDATLGMPTLILPSLQVNMRAGAMPPASPGGQVFLKVPVDAL